MLDRSMISPVSGLSTDGHVVPSLDAACLLQRVSRTERIAGRLLGLLRYRHAASDDLHRPLTIAVGLP
jgi:hypothetical protein